MKFEFEMRGKLIRNGLAGIILMLAVVCLNGTAAHGATQIDIPAPTGSSTTFGKNLTILTNGNFVVADPDFGLGNTRRGAVYLYNGRTGELISSITGGVTAGIGDQLGSGGVYALPSGNYVVRSSSWDNGTLTNVGAMTWCNGATGCVGTVSTANSLYGSTASDAIGSGLKFLALPNGGYAFTNQLYDNGTIVDADALVFGKTDGSTIGELNANNSLRGAVTNPIPNIPAFNFFYDTVNQQFVIGRPHEGKVTIYRQTRRTEFDFDADGRADFAVFRPSSATWFINPSGNPNSFNSAQFGVSTDNLAPADYDGDGRADVAVFRGGVWYTRQSASSQIQYANFGANGDASIASAFVQ